LQQERIVGQFVSELQVQIIPIVERIAPAETVDCWEAAKANNRGKLFLKQRFISWRKELRGVEGFIRQMFTRR
jgi:hypothetical protein